MGPSDKQEGGPAMEPLILIGTANSYFTAKVRSYFRWKHIDFVEVPATTEVYKTYLIPVAGVSQVPVVIDWNAKHANGRPADLVDTTLILQHCEARRYGNGLPLHAGGVEGRFFGCLMEVFADEWLKIVAMMWRWSPQEHAQYLKADWALVVPPGNDVQRAMKQFSGSLPALGVTDATRAAAQSVTHELLEALSVRLAAQKARYESQFGASGRSRAFLLAPHPTLADFSLVGPLGAHLLRDPAPGYLLKTKYPLVALWLEATAGHHGTCPPAPVTVSRTGQLLLSAAPPPPPPPTPPPTPERLEPASMRAKREGEGAADTLGAPALAFGGQVKAGEGEPPPELPGGRLPEDLRRLAAVFFREHAPIIRATYDLLADKRVSAKYARGPSSPSLPRILQYHSVPIGGVEARRAVFPYDAWKFQQSPLSYYRTCSPETKQRILSFCRSFGREGGGVAVLLDSQPVNIAFYKAKLFAAQKPAKL
ncbi:hypothetical protein DIPPA_09553 [Diplonema papillatum]|nr:hypothetical protein DIPPA_09553 [Diplonema papillatum]